MINILDFDKLSVDETIVNYNLVKDDMYLYKTDMLLYSLLHTEFITSNQCLALGFSSTSSVSSTISNLMKDELIRSTTYSHGPHKAYSLTRSGFSKLQSFMTYDYLNEENIDFKETYRPSGHIAHKIATNDMFYTLISSPSKIDFKWLNEKNSTVVNEDTTVLFRNDARFDLKGKTYWIEQDMDTETSKKIKLKANKLAKYISCLKPYEFPELLFTIHKDIIHSSKRRSTYYTSIRKDLDFLNSLRKILKEINRNGFTDADQLLNFLHEVISNPNISSSYISYYKKLIQFTKSAIRMNFIDIETLKTAIKRIDNELKEKKQELLGENLNRAYRSRIKLLRDSLVSMDGDVRLYDLMLKGLNIYLLPNYILAETFHDNLLCENSYIDKSLNIFASSLIDEGLTPDDVTVDVIENNEFVTKENIIRFKNYYNIKVSNSYSYTLIIEDLTTNNIGAQVRIDELLTNYTNKFDSYILLIVTDIQEALKLAAEYKIDEGNINLGFVDKDSISKNEIYVIEKGKKIS